MESLLRVVFSLLKVKFSGEVISSKTSSKNVGDFATQTVYMIFLQFQSYMPQVNSKVTKLANL